MISMAAIGKRQSGFLSESKKRFELTCPAQLRRTSLTHDGKTVLYRYGAQGELLELTDSDKGRTSFEYDAAMRRILMLQPNDASTRTKYDAAGRVAATVFSTRGRGRDDGPLSEAYVYDEAGRKSLVVDSDGKMSRFDYDSSGRLARASYPLTASIMETAFAERLDAGLFPEIVPGDDNEDDSDDPSSSRGFHGGSDRSLIPDLDEAPELGEAIGKALARRQGLYENWRGRGFHSGDHWRPGMGQDYGEFMKPPALSQSELGAARSALDSLDGGYRLDQRARAWTETYAYDERGNRTEKENAWGSIASVYDVENRMTAVGNRTYAYDDNGSLAEESLGSQSLSYRYDDEKRLVEAAATEPSLWGRSQNDQLTSVSYGYDALGRRSTRSESLGFAVGSRDEDEHAPGGRSPSREPGLERTLYDGFSLDSLAVFHDPGESAARSRHEKRKTVVEYLWADGTLLSSTDYYKKESGRYRPVPGRGDRAYYQTDALGTVRAALDSRANVLETWRYDAFGTAYSGSLGDEYRFGYTGKAYDSVTGAYDYGFRDYAPKAGRFTTVDPIRDGTNWYAYCGSDPVNYVDLWGLLENDAAAADLFHVGEPPTGPFIDYMNPSPWNFDLGADYFSNVFTAPDILTGIDNAGKGILEFANDLGIGFLTAVTFGALADLLPVAAESEISSLASTGRTAAVNLTEKLAMEQVVSNPSVGKVLPTVMNDAKNGWYAADGWVKMSQNINGVDVHYIRNTITGAVADFKFK